MGNLKVKMTFLFALGSAFTFLLYQNFGSVDIQETQLSQSTRGLASISKKTDEDIILDKEKIQTLLNGDNVLKITFKGSDRGPFPNFPNLAERKRYIVKTKQCRFTVKFNVNNLADGNTNYGVTPCVTVAQGRNCLEAEGKGNGKYLQLFSCERTLRTLDDIRGFHYAVERNVVSGKRDYDWYQTNNCINAEGCFIKLDDRITAVHLRYKWAQLNPAEAEYNFVIVADHLREISKKGKVATIAVMTGKYTPDWLANDIKVLGIPLKHYNLEDHSQPLMPLPWNKKYQAAFG